MGSTMSPRRRKTLNVIAWALLAVVLVLVVGAIGIPVYIFNNRAALWAAQTGYPRSAYDGSFPLVNGYELRMLKEANRAIGPGDAVTVNGEDVDVPARADQGSWEVSKFAVVGNLVVGTTIRVSGISRDGSFGRWFVLDTATHTRLIVNTSQEWEAALRARNINPDGLKLRDTR